jgi:UPF0271 protein
MTDSASITVDINCDLGESFGGWRLGDDAAMLASITSANVACGFHAGDFSVMDATVALCKRAGVGVGAQPGYPDLQGFGRRPIVMSAAEVEQCVLYQLGALYGFCRAHGVELQHVKAHGALYNQAAADRNLALGIARAVARFSRAVPLLGLAGSTAFAEATAEAGVSLIREAFGDRRYNPDGTLQSRSVRGSVMTDPEQVSHQVMQLVCDRRVRAHDGSTVSVEAESICLHGDTPGAPELAKRARDRLEAAGVLIRPLRSLPRPAPHQ